MKYKLIQYRGDELNKFNDEVNELLNDNWKLEGDYRITPVKVKEGTPYLIYTQVLTKEEEKKAMGFNVFLTEKEDKKNEKIKKKN